MTSATVSECATASASVTMATSRPARGERRVSEKKLTVQVSVGNFFDFDTDSNVHPIDNEKATAETGEF